MISNIKYISMAQHDIYHFDHKMEGQNTQKQILYLTIPTKLEILEGLKWGLSNSMEFHCRCDRLSWKRRFCLHCRVHQHHHPGSKFYPRSPVTGLCLSHENRVVSKRAKNYVIKKTWYGTGNKKSAKDRNQVVVSNTFYFHPYLGKIPILTNIFQRGWNHQLGNVMIPLDA